VFKAAEALGGAIIFIVSLVVQASCKYFHMGKARLGSARLEEKPMQPKRSGILLTGLCLASVSTQVEGLPYDFFKCSDPDSYQRECWLFPATAISESNRQQGITNHYSKHQYTWHQPRRLVNILEISTMSAGITVLP